MTKVILKEGKKKEYKKVLVEGIAMYASVHKPKKAFTDGDIPAYTLELLLTEEEASKLEAEGLKRTKVKVDEDTKKPKEYDDYPGLKVFTLRRKTHKRGEAPGLFGEAKTPLTVVDSNNNPLPSSILVGNGSKVRVSVNPYTMTIKGKEITGHDLLGVQILELVRYAGKSEGNKSQFEPVKGGFTVTNEEKAQTESKQDEDPFQDA